MFIDKDGLLMDVDINNLIVYNLKQLASLSFHINQACSAMIVMVEQVNNHFGSFTF